jgi:hypothetical protein
MSSPPASTPCYCGGAATASLLKNNSYNYLSCRSCAARQLSSKIARYSSAKQKHLQKKRDCQLRLMQTRLGGDDGGDEDNDDKFALEHSKRKSLPDPNQINQEVLSLKERLAILRSQSNDLAVCVTAKTMENDEREAKLQVESSKIFLAQERIGTMKHCLLLQSEHNINTQEGKQIMGGNNDDGRLRDALDYGRHQIQSQRFQFALQVFDMHRIDVGEEYTNQRKGNGEKKMNLPTGVGKIGGLPLPHAGPALYGVLPQEVLASSLRLVASLTNLVARCLGVVLPHPILVCAMECVKCGEFYDFGGDVVDATYFDDGNEGEEWLCDDSYPYHSLCNTCYQNDVTASNSKDQRGFTPGLKSKVSHAKFSSPSNSTKSNKSLMSFVGASARKAMALTASATSRAMSNKEPMTYPSGESTTNTKASEKITSPSAVKKRINHASFAVLAESYEPGATEYVLNPPRLKEDGNEEKTLTRTNEDEVLNNSQSQLFANREDFRPAEERFSIGVQLLQNDVIALCFRAGVDVTKLWPTESVLLNLHALLEQCMSVVKNNK